MNTPSATAHRALALLVRWLKPSRIEIMGPEGPWHTASAALLGASGGRQSPDSAAGENQGADAPRSPADLVIAVGPDDPDPARQVARLIRRGQAILLVDHARWPAEWADLFARHGYQIDDRLRQRLWHASDCDGRIVQGLLLFVPTTTRARPSRPVAIIHPHTHRDWSDPDHVPTERLLGLLTEKARRSAARWARRAGRLLAGRL